MINNAPTTVLDSGDTVPNRAWFSGWRGWNGILFALALWVFALQYSTYLISSLVLDRSIKIASLAVLLVLVVRDHRRLSGRGRVVLLLFVALLATAGLASMLTWDPIGFLQLAKYAFGFLLLPLLICYFPVNQPLPRPVLLASLLLGLFFSIQGMAFVTAVIEELPVGATQIVLERYNNMPEVSFGILGYSNTLGRVSTGKPYTRAQSWFIEPSALGGFLALPAFLFIGLLIGKRRYRYLPCVLIACGGIFATFSLAAFLTVEAGVLALLIIRPCPVERRTFWRCTASLCVFGVAFLGAAQLTLHLMHRLYENQINYGTTSIGWALARNPGGKETGRLVRQAFVDPVDHRAATSAPAAPVAPTVVAAPTSSAAAVTSAPAASAAPIAVAAPTSSAAAVTSAPAAPVAPIAVTAHRSAAAPVTTQRVRVVLARLRTASTWLLGQGLGGTLGTHATNSPNAVIFWLIAGGLPGVLCLLVLQAYVAYCVVLPNLMTPDWRFRSIGAACTASTVHGLAYGTWISPLYLLVLGLAINAADFLDTSVEREPPKYVLTHLLRTARVDTIREPPETTLEAVSTGGRFSQLWRRPG